MFTTNEILETIKMIDEDCLDVRTITMGISLIDCMKILIVPVRRSIVKLPGWQKIW